VSPALASLETDLPKISPECPSTNGVATLPRSNHPPPPPPRHHATSQPSPVLDISDVVNDFEAILKCSSRSSKISERRPETGKASVCDRSEETLLRYRRVLFNKECSATAERHAHFSTTIPSFSIEPCRLPSRDRRESRGLIRSLWIFSGRFEPWRGGRVKTLARGIISCDERARWAPTISRILYCLALNPSGAIFSFSMAR